ncbi:hypothetical protein G7054_g8534 [Neopestalotiopsis clavispora]|nr:hypothetical protein G7054_g8534 [Neopestalotiopsis clavispora]
MARTIGKDDARMLMNHDADARVLEKYYLNLSGCTDMTAVGLGLLGTNNDQSERMTAENHPLAIGAIVYNGPVAMIKLHGAALNAAMAKSMAEHGPIAGTPHQQKLPLRRLRKAAKKSLLRIESQKLRETISTIKYDKRVQVLNSSKITDTIIQAARKAIEDSAVPNDDSDDSIVDKDTGFCKKDNDHNDPQANAEEDLESLFVTSDSNEIFRGNI